jgi:hypothetical protein
MTDFKFRTKTERNAYIISLRQKGETFRSIAKKVYEKYGDDVSGILVRRVWCKYIGVYPYVREHIGKHQNDEYNKVIEKIENV